MSYNDVDDLLDEVDKWKFKLYKKLKKMTPEQEAEHWKQSRQKLRELGLTVPEPGEPAKRPVKRGRRAVG
jgi:hypothetical protein